MVGQRILSVYPVFLVRSFKPDLNGWTTNFVSLSSLPCTQFQA